jgi:hypothetical protein
MLFNSRRTSAVASGEVYHKEGTRMQSQIYASIIMRATGVGLLLAAVVAAPVSAAPAGNGLEQPAPPAASQGTVETLVSVGPAPAVPAGGPPTGLPAVPDRFAEPLGPFTMDMEVVASASPSEVGLLASPGCVSDSVFKRGMKLVFRFELYDMDNKVRVTSADGSTAQINMPDGSALTAYFRPRGGVGANPSTALWMWTTVWQIPTDYPLGPVLYSVDVATPDGRAATLDPPSLAGQPVQPGVPLSMAGTFPTIIP